MNRYGSEWTLTLLLAACAPSTRPRTLSTTAHAPPCTPAPVDDPSADGAALLRHCRPPHVLATLGTACATTFRFHTAAAIEQRSDCSDRVFARAGDAGLASAAEEAGRICTEALLRTAPAAPCAVDQVARAICDRASQCGRSSAIEGCATNGRAQLADAIERTTGLWNERGRAALAECMGALPCGLDRRRTTALDCLVSVLTGGQQP